MKNMKQLFLIGLLLISVVAGAQVQYGGGVNTFTSTVNSSASTLTSASVFTGTSEDISQYSEARVFVFSDVASATDGLAIQQSANGTNWDNVDSYTIPASTGKAYGVGVSAKFFRVVYTNGGTNQTSFRLQTIFHKVRTKPSSQRPADARTNDNDMEEDLAYTLEYDPIANIWNRTKLFSQYFTGQAAQTALVNNIIPATASSSATDLSDYGTGLVQIVCPAGTYTTGQIIFEGANDSPTSSIFQTIPVYNQLTGASFVGAITLATTTNIGYVFPINFRYIRVRISTAVSGASASVQAVSKFSKATWSNPFATVIQSNAANLNVTATGTLTAVTTLANGQTAHSTASTGSPLRIGGRVMPTTPDLTLAVGDASDLGMTLDQQGVVKMFAPSEYDYTFNGAFTNSTTANVFKAAAGASIRNYVSEISVTSDALATATEVWVEDANITFASQTIASNIITSSAVHDLKIGDAVNFTASTITGITAGTIYYVLTVPATNTLTLSATPNGSTLAISGTSVTGAAQRILYRAKISTTGALTPVLLTFATPLRGTPNGAIDIRGVTATVTGAIYYNVHGYLGF